MYKIKKHIEIVRSSIPGYSSMSVESAQALQAALRRNYAKVNIFTLSSAADLDQLVLLQPDLAFLGVKRIPSFDGSIVWLSDFLQKHHILHTGSAREAHMLELDKAKAKQRITDAGLTTAPFFVAPHGQTLTEDMVDLRYPVFVKPTNRGGGQGVDDHSVAHNFIQLKAKVQSISDKYAADSLIEQFLNGREFSVAILKELESDNFMAMPLELIAPVNSHGYRLLGSAVKSADTETFAAVKDEALKNSLAEFALDAFHALGARDYGRIDIRMDSHGTPHFLEANLIPSVLKDYGNFLKACKLNQNMDYETAINHVVQLALRRAPLFEPTDLRQPGNLVAGTLSI